MTAPSSIHGIGTDICAVHRIRASLQRHGRDFAEKILTPAELHTWQERTQRNPDRGERFLATRFAAKEAFSKAIGLGMRAPMSWHTCEVALLDSGQPYFVLHAPLKPWFESQHLHASLSISDESDYVVSFVVVQKMG